MSSSLLPSIQALLVRYGITTIMVLGCIGNVCVVFFFSKHHKNACALFLLNAAAMNIIYLTLSVPLTVYTYEYGDPSLNSMALCKLRYYLFHVWGQISRYSIALACIDRFAVTHINSKIRAISQTYVAGRLIGFITVFWYIFPIHIMIMTTIKNGRCGYFDLYYTLNSIYALIFVCLIPPIIMTIFGYRAFRNMKRLHTRVQPTRTSSNSLVVHRQDRNLLVMLLAEASVYVITMSLYPAIILEVAVTNSMTANKSLQEVEIENFILFIAQFLIYLNTSAPFYIYCAVSKKFRNDFKKTIGNCCRWMTRQ
jgi:hypothetical protein